MEKDKFGIGVVILVFISLVVGLIFFQSIAQTVGTTTNTETLANQSLGDLENGTLVYVTNCKALSDVAIFNATGDVEIPSDEYTVTNNVVYNGALAVSILPDVDISEGYDVGVATIDGTCQPLTYISDGGSRAVVGIILIFFALLLAVIALSPVRENLKDLFGM